MKFNRRDFITAGGLAGLGFLFRDAIGLTEKIADGVLSNAYAAEFESKRFVTFFADGAVPNWMFNLALYPEEAHIPPAYAIPGVGTGFSSGDGGLTTVFNQQKMGNYYYPQMWFNNIPTGVSGWVSPSSLLTNSLSIRGVWNASDGHRLSNIIAYKPFGSNDTLQGMVADASSRPIPAIISGNGTISRAFSSPKGRSALSSGNPATVINAVKDSFKTTGTELFRKSPILDAAIKQTLDTFQAKTLNKKSSSSFNRKQAEELIRANLATLVTDYTTTLAKYTALINRACVYNPADSNTLLTDLFSSPLTNYSGAGSKAWLPDSTGNMRYTFAPGRDLREIFLTPPQLINMAESFAMAEVLLKSNLSSNITLDIFSMNTFSDIVLDKTTGLPLAGNKAGWNFDDGHNMGVNVQTLIWSVYHRGFITCLYEFREFLKANSMFDDTVIYFTSDFSRAPVFDGRQSDHGWQGNTATIWCGEIKEPLIIGDTYKDASSVTGNNYKNMWGVGRIIPYLGAHVGNGHVNSTLATILGVPSNSANNKSLVSRSGGVVAPLTGTKTS